MARRGYSVARVEEIQRLIKQGLSDRKIARALHCRRTQVAEVRAVGPEAPAGVVACAIGPAVLPAMPAWAETIEWSQVLAEIGRGFELKRIWEERAAAVTGYPNFWKYLEKRHPGLLRSTVAIREFAPGSQCEVDWAGPKIPWWDAKGRRHEAHVFIGTLCHSQLIFGHAFGNEKTDAWIAAHEKMYAAFKGVPAVTAPDNCKTGVARTHLYDPDVNSAYFQLAVHYGTAVVPARVRRPKDKALAELAVKLVIRLFRWMYRDRRFQSLAEVNAALAAVCERINTKPHSRFKISRKERWERNERPALRALPETPFQQIEWRKARVHPDSTIAFDSALYTVPHIHRGREVRVKGTSRQVEVFLGFDRVAIHARDRSRSGVRVIDPSHLPPNAKAYLETTPQHLLSQARFVSSDLHGLIDGLFQEDALGHLRRAQGLIRHARSEIAKLGRTEAELRIRNAVAQMRRFGKFRVSYFESLLAVARKRRLTNPAEREIARIPGNPMLREQPAAAPEQQLGLALAPPPPTDPTPKEVTGS